MWDNVPVFAQYIAYATYTILMFSLILALIFFSVLAFIQYDMEKRLKRDYINTLDEHDKNVILNYQNIKYDVFKKRKR